MGRPLILTWHNKEPNPKTLQGFPNIAGSGYPIVKPRISDPWPHVPSHSAPDANLGPCAHTSPAHTHTHCGDGLWHLEPGEFLHPGKSVAYQLPAYVRPILTAPTLAMTQPHPPRCHLSSCCKAVFMHFTCWKWQDMSVANTISMTRARSSLDGQNQTAISPHHSADGPEVQRMRREGQGEWREVSSGGPLRPSAHTNSSLVRLMKMFISSSCIIRKTELMW